MRRLPAAALSATGLLLFLGAHWLFVTTGRGSALDERALSHGLLASHRAHQVFVAVPPVAVAATLVAAALAWRRRLGLVGVLAVLLPTVSVVAADLLKYVWDSSFPSGHTATAAGSMVALLLVAPSRPLAALAPLWPGVVAASLVSSGAHRPADTFGAALLVATAGCAVLAVSGGGVSARRWWAFAAVPALLLPLAWDLPDKTGLVLVGSALLAATPIAVFAWLCAPRVRAEFRPA